MVAHLTDIAFTPAVKAVQDRLGSRDQMEVMSRHRGFGQDISRDFAVFLERVDSFFLASATATGRPYIQHRGGTPGFVRIDGPRTISIPDYPGNKQYVTMGNLTENDRVAAIFVDFETKSRIKLWGRARVESIDDRETRRIVIEIEAWDINCPQHIPDLFRPASVARAQEKLLARIAELEAKLATLKGQT